jgi:hypothetical protein
MFNLSYFRLKSYFTKNLFQSFSSRGFNLSYISSFHPLGALMNTAVSINLNKLTTTSINEKMGQINWLDFPCIFFKRKSQHPNDFYSA